MSRLSAAELRLLKEVCSLPTAPFREEQVQEFVLFQAQELGLDAVSDRFGNIVVEYRPPAAKRKKLPRAVAFTAHMDHPGFVVTRFDSKTSKGVAEVRGGVPASQFPGQALIFFCDGNYVKAVGTSEFHRESTEPGTFATIEFETRKKAVPVGAIGWHDVVFARAGGDRFHSKSADDLAQVALELALLARLKESEAIAHVYCLFTRAEEVGFVGAGAMVDSGLMPPEDVPLIVLECSKWLPGVAEIGKGPVLRVGDAATVYDPDVDRWMLGVARAKLTEATKEAAEADTASGNGRNGKKKSAPDFAFQRALMTGGVCEAGLYARHRTGVGALALPLGNYHNAGEKGGEPEVIGLSDCAWQLELMEALALSPFDPDGEDTVLTRLARTHQKLGGLLDGNEFASRKVGKRK